MTKLTMDGAALAKLREAKGRVELCDPDGRTVGYFEPTASAIPDFDEAEVERRMAEFRAKGGYTTAQVLDHLRKLGER